MGVSKMTSQRRRSWNVARRQFAKGDFGVRERYILFTLLHERSLQKLILKYVRYTFFKQVGIISGNHMMKL